MNINPLGLVASIIGGNKMLLVAIAGAAVVSVIGYHFVLVGNLRYNINELRAEKVLLEQSNTALTTANESLRENNRLVLEELANLRNSDREAREQLATALNNMRSAEARAARAAARNDDPQRFIANTNTQIRCLLENMFDPNAACAAITPPARQERSKR